MGVSAVDASADTSDATDGTFSARASASLDSRIAAKPRASARAPLGWPAAPALPAGAGAAGAAGSAAGAAGRPARAAAAQELGAGLDRAVASDAPKDAADSLAGRGPDDAAAYEPDGAGGGAPGPRGGAAALGVAPARFDGAV